MQRKSRSQQVLALSLRELNERHARIARTLSKSEKTIAWYTLAVRDFTRFLEEVCGVMPQATLRDFTLERVRDYILYLRGRPSYLGHPFTAPRTRALSDASVNCYVRGLQSLASWLYEQEYTDANVLDKLKTPRVTRHAVEILTDEEIGCILSYLNTPTATNVRNRAIFLTLLDTGIRASELLTLTVPRLHPRCGTRARPLLRVSRCVLPLATCGFGGLGKPSAGVYRGLGPHRMRGRKPPAFKRGMNAALLSY